MFLNLWGSGDGTRVQTNLKIYYAFFILLYSALSDYFMILGSDTITFAVRIIKYHDTASEISNNKA